MSSRARPLRCGPINLDVVLATVGGPHLVGSAALDLIAWLDLDMTVV